MALRIVRNDITKMNTEAIVNTANDQPTVGTGCDHAIYTAAGYEELLSYRKEHIGIVPEGDAFITPAFHLKARYIIHAVSPLYVDGNQGEEEKLRFCYRKSLQLARENRVRSIAFPLISTGGFGYPLEEGMRIAVDEINAFLLGHEMDIFLVVFDNEMTDLGKKIYPGLESYIDQNYVEEKKNEEYFEMARRERRMMARPVIRPSEAPKTQPASGSFEKSGGSFLNSIFGKSSHSAPSRKEKPEPLPEQAQAAQYLLEESFEENSFDCYTEASFEEFHENKLQERMKHLSDTFSEYLMYLIQQKGLENADVWRNAIVDKKVFSKIKNNPDYHPQKRTALCLCMGARLNLDESKDLLARAGYALSPCDKTDIIFSYFIENQIYDMIELDIQLEEHGLPCIIV